jgi:MAX dimerization protein
MLLMAAEYVDRAEAEHGYACKPAVERPQLTHVKQEQHYHHHSARRHRLQAARKSITCRTSHNELEKNRRAELRAHINRLKDVVPLGSGASRHTTQGLLTKACLLIKSLEGSLSVAVETRDRLVDAQRQLRRRYFSLTSTPYRTTSSGRRWSDSRCSMSSESSIGDCSSLSSESSHDTELIDVVESDDTTDSGCDDEPAANTSATGRL